MNKTAKRILYITIALVVIAAIAYPKLPKSKSGENLPGSTTPVANKLKVNALIIKGQPLNNQVNITGTILADESVLLNSEVAGKVAKILFKEGQSVRKGDLLVSLNDDEVKAELEKLKFTEKLNQDSEFRQKQLLQKEAISREEYETSLTTLNTTRAEIKVMEARLSKHHIAAPFDGVVGLRNISEGSYLNPGAGIAELYKINPIKLEFNVPSRYLDKVNVGDKIEFKVDAYEETFHGNIYALEPQIDPQTRSIRLRANAENPESKLLPGQFTRINLTLETLPSALMVPTEAVIPELSGKKVFVYRRGVVNSQAIETGIRTEKNIQVIKGLAAGDTVITSGILQINQGSEVDLNLN